MHCNFTDQTNLVTCVTRHGHSFSVNETIFKIPVKCKTGIWINGFRAPWCMNQKVNKKISREISYCNEKSEKTSWLRV